MKKKLTSIILSTLILTGAVATMASMSENPPRLYFISTYTCQ